MACYDVTHVFEAAVDPRDGAVLSPGEANVLSFVVLANQVDHSISVAHSRANAVFVIRATIDGMPEVRRIHSEERKRMHSQGKPREGTTGQKIIRLH